MSNDDTIEYGSAEDLINNDTEEISITYKDKRYDLTVKQSLSNTDMWSMIDSNMEGEELDLQAFVVDYLDTVVTDASFDNYNSVFREGDFAFTQEIYNEIGDPLEELNIDNTEGN